MLNHFRIQKQENEKACLAKHAFLFLLDLHFISAFKIAETE